MILIIQTERETIGVENVAAFSVTRGDFNGYDSIDGEYDNSPEEYPHHFSVDVWTYELYCYKDVALVPDYHTQIVWKDREWRVGGKYHSATKEADHE